MPLLRGEGLVIRVGEIEQRLDRQKCPDGVIATSTLAEDVPSVLLVKAPSLWWHVATQSWPGSVTSLPNGHPLPATPPNRPESDPMSRRPAEAPKAPNPRCRAVFWVRHP